jgi:dipeptidyl aminopeptidase/acylaminoacyl peptidase
MIRNDSILEEMPMIKQYIVVLSFLVLAGCKAGNGGVNTSTITPLPQTISPTISPIFTATASSMPTVSSDVMRYQCLEIADRPPANYRLEGTLVYNNDDNTNAFLWNNDTKNAYRFPRAEGDRLLQFDVSPDRKHIVYIHHSIKKKEDRLVIATADGQPIWSQAIDSYYWNWFDRERLVGLVVPEKGKPSLFILNPFSGERQELRADYPDSRLFSNNKSPHWQYSDGGLPIYDPTLTRVIYPECNSQCQNRLISGEPGWPIALWDIETDQVIARIMTMDSYGNTPLWTPDGKQFIIATKIDPNDPYPPANEFFAMSREGQLRQLTHFKDYYEQLNIPDNYILSPDGRLLAFWIVATPSQYDGARLAVMNTETGEVTNYCIQGDPLLNKAPNSNSLADPIWSPDSTQLLVVTPNLEDQSSRRIVLVDLVRNYAAQIAEDVKPVGWMIAP